ncbi:MAG: alpha-L-fucosidase [Peptostreptococcaceae bacterium]
MKPTVLPRIEKFEKMAFGLFIHWGLYSLKEKGEWTMKLHNIPKNEYSKLSEEFKCKEYDAKKIVKIAKNAGIKYITITSKHHDGFFLYDTKGLSSYDAVSCAPKRDLIKEFVDACKEEDIMPIFYHATYDWYEESYDLDFNSYLEYLKKSVEILCKEYGEIGGFWFDGNWAKPEADWKLDELYGTIRRYQPNALIINNTGLSRQGEVIHEEIDSVTYEQGNPMVINRDGISKYVMGEVCQTTNKHWGYAKNDFNYKSPKEVIETLCKCRSVGANYLLNAALGKEGSFNKIQEGILEVVGQWININGEAIYDVRPTQIKSAGRDFVMENDDKNLFLFIHDLKIVGDENVILGEEGKNLITFTNVKQKIEKVKWLDNEEELKFTQNEELGTLTIDATGYAYGTDLIVRVAKAFVAISI